MAELRHMAMCTKNNRRLARFYRLIFGLEEVWNENQNSATAFYIGDGRFNVNCLQVHSGSGRAKIVDGREILPDVEINHIGFKVKSIPEIEKKLADLNPPIKLVPSRRDGRYEDQRFVDLDGNDLELAEGDWDSGESQGISMIKHVGIETKDPSRLADFYKSILSLKEVDRHGTSAIYLSDETVNLALVKDSPVPKRGIQLFGFQVQSIEEIEERLKRSPRAYTYPGESPVEIKRRPLEGPYKATWLQDPDGNCVDISEEGWLV